jgi:hypothetical protein
LTAVRSAASSAVFTFRRPVLRGGGQRRRRRRCSLGLGLSRAVGEEVLDRGAGLGGDEAAAECLGAGDDLMEGAAHDGVAEVLDQDVAAVPQARALEVAGADWGFDNPG